MVFVGVHFGWVQSFPAAILGRYYDPLEFNVGRVNLLIGANGAGKSNIVSFFRMLNYMMHNDLQLYIERSGAPHSFLNFGPKCTRDIHCSVSLSVVNSVKTFDFVLTFAVPDKLLLTSEKITSVYTNGTVKTKIYEPENFRESVLATSIDNLSVGMKRDMASCRVFQFHDSSAEGPLRQASPINTARFLQSEGGNIASFLYLLKTEFPYSYRKVVSTVSEACPQFKDFYLVPNQAGYVNLAWTDKTNPDYVLSAHQFSDGTIRFIALATLLLQPKDTIPNVIVIDEPELGLHPSAIGVLADMVRDASLNAQVIMATQSPLLIDYFDAGDIRVVDHDAETNSTVLRQLDAESLQMWLKEYSISELWEKNVIGGQPW